MSVNQINTYWLDSKKAAKEIGVSNRKLLLLLDKEGVTYRDKYGVRRVVSESKHIARNMQKTWISKNAESYRDSQYYMIVQLSSEGIDYCQTILNGAINNEIKGI